MLNLYYTCTHTLPIKCQRAFTFVKLCYYVFPHACSSARICPTEAQELFSILHMSTTVAIKGKPVGERCFSPFQISLFLAAQSEACFLFFQTWQIFVTTLLMSKTERAETHTMSLLLTKTQMKAKQTKLVWLLPSAGSSNAIKTEQDFSMHLFETLRT